MSDYVQLLVDQSRRERVAMSPALDAALQRLDEEFERLAPALRVEYVGPGVGVEGAADVYRLVVRPHEWVIHQPTWSLKICDALPNANWRAAWTVAGASRARKAMVVKALPEFLGGFEQAVRRAGLAATPAGRRVAELAAAFA